MNKKALRTSAEEILIKKEISKNQNLEKLSLEEVSLIIHDLEVHKIELEMQNEELQKTQIELEDAKARYFDLYNLAPEGYLVVSEKGLILEANLTGARILGQAKSKIFKQRLSQFIYDEDQDLYYLHRKKLFESLLPQEYELRMVGNKGTPFWAHIKATVIIAEDQVTCRLILSDVTERKKLDLQLQQSMDDLLESQRIAHLGTWRLDISTNTVVWSEELYKMYGMDPTIRPPLYPEHMKYFTPESWNKLSKAIERTRTKGIPYELELETVMIDGQNGWMWVRGEAEKNLDGNISSLRGVAHSITERKKLDLQLQQSMDDLLESQRIAHLGTWRLDISTNTVVWSEELYKIYGFDPTIPPPPYTEHMNLFTPKSWNVLAKAVEMTRTKGIPYELELETVKTDGSNGWIWARGEAEKDSGGNISSIRGAAQSITERKRLENELQKLCYHDHLTELHNRRFLEKETIRLDVKENWPLSVIMYDVNGLKLVNDAFGHESGDALLKKAAEVIKKGCREEDIIARVGGDEFVVLLPKTTSEEALQVANHIKELAANEEVANIELSISYGYDSKTTDTQSIFDIIANAENHMYQQKLYERSSLRSNTIDFIMNALFEKSNPESTHSSRVSFICQSIATKMNLSNNIVSKLKIAGLIHDIGKIGVKEKTLNKSGKLTKEELKEVQRHPEIGWRLLSATTEFSELSKYVLAHHEKWDGSGYPNKFKGEEIPIEARIIAVADAYDAMTGERSYPNRMTQEEAIEELIRCAGTHFDPMIIEIFVNQVLPDSHVSNHLNLISYD